MHTHGPWHERQATGSVDRHILGEDAPVAIVPYKWGSVETRAANARLIASAPDLLEALEEVAAAKVVTSSSRNAETIWRLKKLAEDNLAKARKP